MLTLPVWFVGLHVFRRLMRGSGFIQDAPSGITTLLNVLRLRSTMTRVVPICLSAARLLSLNTTTPRVQVNGNQETRDCDVRLPRMCLTHICNDILNGKNRLCTWHFFKLVQKICVNSNFEAMDTGNIYVLNMRVCIYQDINGP